MFIVSDDVCSKVKKSFNKLRLVSSPKDCIQINGTQTIYLTMILFQRAYKYARIQQDVYEYVLYVNVVILGSDCLSSDETFLSRCEEKNVFIFLLTYAPV